MKKTFGILIIIALTLFCLASCNKAPSAITLIINGDIEGYFEEVDLLEYTLNPFDNGDGNQMKGYQLSQVINSVNTLNDNNWLLITASDKTSALVESNSADKIYIVIENDELHIKAPQHPRLVGIKDVEDITVVSKNESLESGLKIINEKDDIVVSYGNVKLMLFEMTANNKMYGNIAYKYMPKEKVKLSDLTQEEKNLVYFDNFDITKDYNDGYLIWEDGRLGYSRQDKIYQGMIFGIIAGIDTVLYDSYYVMKNALDNDQKVMFILPDGLSIEQIEYYYDDLRILNANYKIAASVHPAISNVALASILTGVSPYKNGIWQRGVKAPDVPDIFEYALSLNKTVRYIEGNSNLVVTSVAPTLNIADVNGYTDTNVYNSAIKALEDDPDLIFIHFHGIDDVGHQYSAIHNRTKEKIIKIESYIINLIDAFDGIVIILPDHGMITYYEDDIAKGRHGFFEWRDMLVPYYIMEDSNE